MKECGRKLIGLRATPLLANSPIRLANWLGPLLQVFYYQTKRCHTSSYKERQKTLIGSRTFCHFTSLPAQSQSNSLSLSTNSLFHSPPYETLIVFSATLFIKEKPLSTSLGLPPIWGMLSFQFLSGCLAFKERIWINTGDRGTEAHSFPQPILAISIVDCAKEAFSSSQRILCHWF